MLEQLSKIVGATNVFVCEPMRKHTSFRIGGTADYLLTPDTVSGILELIDFFKNKGIPYFVMGNGSNLLVGDKGYRGVVIKISGGMNNVQANDNYITGQSGILLSKLANFAYSMGLSGLEFAGGIPGTLGGAVMMNAGAYDGEMKNAVIETQYINENGELKSVYGEEHEFGYRTSCFDGKNIIIIESKLKLEPANKTQIKLKMESFAKLRREKQPLDMPSAGSTFKRPEDYFAGKLIEDAGLKGFSIGGAMVSPKHSGFVVNTGEASAKDVKALIEHVQNEVYGKFGVKLQTEVKFVGEF